MIVAIPVATFNAGLTAAGLTSADVAIRDRPGAADQQIQPLTMRGLRYLVWELGMDVPDVDVQILQTNILARIAGVSQAWTQT